MIDRQTQLEELPKIKVTRRGRELLARAALGHCVYDGDGLPPCAEEWADDPKQWCGACLAREVGRG